MRASSILVINVNPKFRQKGDLKKHIMSVHENVKYPCDQCAFKAAEKGYLKRHKMSVHVKVKYHCD